MKAHREVPFSDTDKVIEKLKPSFGRAVLMISYKLCKPDLLKMEACTFRVQEDSFRCSR